MLTPGGERTARMAIRVARSLRGPTGLALLTLLDNLLVMEGAAPEEPAVPPPVESGIRRAMTPTERWRRHRDKISNQLEPTAPPTGTNDTNANANGQTNALANAFETVGLGGGGVSLGSPLTSDTSTREVLKSSRARTNGPNANANGQTNALANAPDSLFELGAPGVPRAVADRQQVIFDAWAEVRKKAFPSSHSPKLDAVRRKAIDAAMALEYSVEDLKAAVQGIVLRGDAHAGRAETFVWALRDAASIDNCIAVTEEYRARREALDAVEVRRPSTPVEASHG